MNNKSKSDGRSLTVRGLIIGSIGSVIITMSSMFIALKMSSLPWPIIFVALASMFSLKALGNTNLHEINVTHTAMSAGAMVSGGLAFTIPGMWGAADHQELNIPVLLAISLGGTVLGLIFTAMIRKYFIETKDLNYPMGQAAADTLVAGDEGGTKAKILFGSMGVVAVYTVLRDWFQKIPAVWFSKRMGAYGSSAGLYFSPMLIGIGYILGPVMIGVWFIGALIGDVGILLIGQKSGLLDLVTATNIKASLGIGLMVGSGIGILIKGILPNLQEIIKGSLSKDGNDELVVGVRPMAVIAVIIAVIFSTVCHLGPIASIITILGAWLATSMSAECVGQTGVNPMEIFGILVLLLVRAITSLGGQEMFYVAAIVAVAAGLVGDVMNDFKAGHILGTNHRDMWISEAVGGILGAVAAVFTLVIIYKGYGAGAIGGEQFPAAQAMAVASMVNGISHIPAFVIGVIAAVVLYLLNFPVMTLGLGVYLPMYMSCTAFLGGALRFVLDKVKPGSDGTGNIIASGCLGGEAIIGVIISIILAIQAI